MTRETQIAEDAALWVNRLDQPAIDTSASRAFDAWMAADEAHRDTFTDLQGLWDSDALTEALRQTVADPATPDLVMPPIASPPERRTPIWLASAAGAAAATLIMLLPSMSSITYRTGLGDGRSVVLADGSHVALSGNTELRVRVLPWRRIATLERGEAFFDVVHERWRPFRVHSGETSVAVLGTAFNVDRQSATRTAVEVYRGAVALDAGQYDHLVLRKGDRARVVDDRITTQTPNPTLGAIASAKPDWTAGWFEAADVPLSVLIAKVQRHSARPIRLHDPALGALPVTGRFRVSDPARVLNAIRDAYALDVRYDRRAIVIAPSRDKQGS
jgi:transmembrane sensor